MKQHPAVIRRMKRTAEQARAVQRDVAAQTPSTWVCICGAVNRKSKPCSRGC